jgi:E3 ubiquitin-protein ligase mind-bomb
VLVEKRQGKQKISSKGTFIGAHVTRGPDWDWGDQDGGITNKGIVKDVRKWEDETFRSVVSVTWPTKECNVYRRGHKGKVRRALLALNIEDLYR